jgi:hypothetical protein
LSRNWQARCQLVTREEVDFSPLPAMFCARVLAPKEGVEMNRTSKKSNPLAEVLRSQHEEIKKYKWIESEKVGRDIGWERASREWLDKHFPDWKRYRWKRAIADAIKAENGLN